MSDNDKTKEWYFVPRIPQAHRTDNLGIEHRCADGDAHYGDGYLTIVSYDATDERESWNRSLQLLMNDVLPRCNSVAPIAERRFGVG